MRTPSRIAFLAACATILIANSALTVAAPPADLVPNPTVSEWFKSLRQPGTLLPCCSISDCQRVDYRIADDGRYEVMLDGTWYRVPNRFVLRQEGNPVGRAVACYTTIFGYGSLRGNGSYDGDQIEILCFVPERPVSSQQLLNVDA
jgi:hypothetical protein